MSRSDPAVSISECNGNKARALFLAARFRLPTVLGAGFLVSSVLQACVPALPGGYGSGSGGSEARRYAYDANESATEARRFADEARTQFERGEMLLQESKVMLERAEAAQSRCNEVSTRIAKQASRTIIRARGKAKPIEAVQPAATPAPQEPVKPALPQHSASDAPY